MKPINPLADDLDHILKHTEGLWEELRGNRIFITGGTGFFGCWLLESFAWANEKLALNSQALVLTRSPDILRNKAPHLLENQSIKFHIGDVRSFNFPDGEFSHIIHAATAASAKLNDENPLEMLDTIIDGTRRTLDFAVKCGAKKFLLTSSGAVYGKQPPDMTHIPEDYMGGPDTMNPSSAYAEGKRVSELLCAIYSKKFGIECTIARCFAFVGPYLPLDIHYAIGNFIRDALNGGPIVVKGDGTPFRSYLYAADLVIWLLTILIKGESCGIYNVGSQSDMSIETIARLISDVPTRPLEVKIKQPQSLGATVERYVPSVSRAGNDLKLREHVDFVESVKRTMRFESSDA